MHLERIVINIPGSVSEVLVGEKLESAANMLPEHGVVHYNRRKCIKDIRRPFPDFPVFPIKPGEESKRLSVVEDLAGRLLEAGIAGMGFISAIGGGVVCDIAGFLGSIYMRGIRFAYVSTTLLSQVDASTGGKNGVNAGHAKNMLGCFSQPEFVICDTGMLSTLPEEEYLSDCLSLSRRV
jgi:3-dehydroquinate synthase